MWMAVGGKRALEDLHLARGVGTALGVWCGSCYIGTTHFQGDSAMAKTATARARVEPEVKEEAEKILRDCGLNASQAISLFYRQVILERGMPFRIKSFNEETRRVLKNSEQGIEVEQFESADALFEDLGI